MDVHRQLETARFAVSLMVEYGIDVKRISASGECCFCEKLRMRLALNPLVL